jgi:TonB family protein
MLKRQIPRRLARPSACRALRLAFLVCLALITSGVICSLSAQKADHSAKPERTSRRLLYKVEPDYPWELKERLIGGAVRLDIVISARGTVDNVTPIGGNPVLLDCAARAVKKWKYTPADSETELVLNLMFDPRR